MIVVDNGLTKRTLTEKEEVVLFEALAQAKKERIRALEKVNSLGNIKLRPEDFSLDVLDELIKLFSCL